VQQALYFRREWRYAVDSWFRGDVFDARTAVNSGEHMGARFSGVRVSKQTLSYLVAKN
jgi:hypothetical protein